MIVSVERLTKRFRPPASLRELSRGRLRGAPLTALEEVSFSVGAGEAFALMGPNGAGKSTLLRVLAGLVAPDEGRAVVDGLDCARGGPRLGARVGYLAADERGLELNLSPREYVAFFAALHNLPRKQAVARADQLLAEVGLAAAAQRPLGDLSTGMRRRAALARALLGNPAVLLLDEPTRGLDPAGAVGLRALFADAMARGVALVLATHDADEARALSQRVAVMEAGRFVAVEAPESARRRLLSSGAAHG